MSEQAMLTPMFPSQWSPAGLIHHLTHDVERFWFRKVLFDDPGWHGMPRGSEAWDVPENRTAKDIVDEYVAETAKIDEQLAQTRLDAVPRWWDAGLFGHEGPANLHEIIVHVIVETATHAGHLDIARELYDGGQFLVLTDESRPGRSTQPTDRSLPNR
jgi:hypothetical protein